MSLLLPGEIDKVDPERWGTGFDVSDEKDHTPKIVTGYILYQLRWYEREQYDDRMLWEWFKDNFGEWTKELFLLGDSNIVHKFRDHLRAYGVYVPKDGKRIAENLAATVAEVEYHEWTEDEANEQLKISKHFHSQWNPNTDEYRIPAPHFSRINPQQTDRQTPQTSRINPQQTVQHFPQQLSGSNPQQHPYLPPEPNPQNQFQYVYGQDQPTGQTPPSDPAINTPPEIPYRTRTTLPGGAVQQQAQMLPDVPSKSITDLMKIYNDDEKKFGGDMYDIIDTKLRIFYDCCAKVGVLGTQYQNAYSVMLKGRAATFYCDRLSNKSYSFEEMVRLTKVRFETEENRQLHMSEWRETTLPRVISDNPDKTRLECLQLMFDKLQKVQRGLSVVYQTEYSLRGQVISACRGVPECNLALYKPADTYEGVCAELRSSIGTAIRARELQLQQFNTYADGNDNDNQYDQNWTDRMHGGRGRYRRGVG